MLSLKNLVAKVAHNNIKISKQLLVDNGLKIKVLDFSELVKVETARQKILKLEREKRSRIAKGSLSARLWKYKNNKKIFDDIKSDTIIDVQRSNCGKFIINGVIFKVEYNENKDYDYYSKSWHSKYGAKTTVSNRRLEVCKIDKFYNITTDYVVANFDAFQGNYLIKAVAEFFKLEKIKVSKSLKAVQLNDYFNIILIHRFKDYRIFKIMFCDQVVNYCIVDNDYNTFHGSKSELVNGLQNKVQAKVEKLTTVIDIKYCKSLGFCNLGISSFISDNNLHCDSLTFKELQEVVSSNKEINRKYTSELRKMGISI